MKMKSKDTFQVKMKWQGQQIITLADIVPEKPKVLFIGLNPTPESVKIGHYHQGKLGKQFWKLLEKWAIIPEPSNEQYHDELLIDLNYGITDLVKRPTSYAEELVVEEKKYGSMVLKKLIESRKPKVICSIYKNALSEIVRPHTLKNRWGYLDNIQFVKSNIFILPFPFQNANLVKKHMPVLKYLINS